MSNRVVTGRQKSNRGGRRWNSNLPKGNQHTTPEKEEERAKKRERKQLEQDPAYLFGANPAELKEGRRRVRNLLTDSQEDLAAVVGALLEKAKDGSFKHQELVLAYIAGKPISMTHDVDNELSGDELFDVAESVKGQLGEDWKVIPGGKAESA